MHIQTPTDATTITVSVCVRCGTIEKSDKMSCCGRGGSWFKNCGGAGNTKLHHTWSEGIQACKSGPQSKTVIGQRLSVVQHKDMDSSQGADMTNDKAVIATTKTFAFTSANTSTLTSVHTLITDTSDNNTLMTSPIQTSFSALTTSQTCVNLLNISVIVLMFCILVWVC